MKFAKLRNFIREIYENSQIKQNSEYEGNAEREGARIENITWRNRMGTISRE